MSRDITIKGKLQYKDRTPIDGARVRIWEVDPAPKNPDDLIVDATTTRTGGFSGTGRWKDGRKPEVGRYRYEVSHKGKRKRGGNILNPHKFFSTLQMPWDGPKQNTGGGGSKPSGGKGGGKRGGNNDITISGRLLAKGKRLPGARIRIWDMDVGNPKDLIVDALTDVNGKFSGTGTWKEGALDKPRFRYEITLANHTKTGKNILNPHKFFALLETDFPASVTWTNWNSNFGASMPRANFRQPTTPDQVRAALQDAIRNNLKVKVVGSGHSMSAVAQPARNNMAMDISAMSGLLPRYAWEKSNATAGLAAKRDLVNVQAGTALRTLYTALARQNKGLINMGPFDGQTIAGVVNTNTHGNGLRWPGFSDMVRSMEMFVVVPIAARRHRVERWVIEPTNGISDPAAFKRERGDASLIQNDDVFYSAVCGYGLFGIAISYVLEVRELYWLDEKVQITTWGRVRNKMRPLAEETLTHPVHQLKVYVNTAEANATGGVKSITPVRIERLREQPVRSKPNGWENNIHPIWPPMRRKQPTSKGGTWALRGLGKSGKPSPITLGLLRTSFFSPTKPSFLNGAHGIYRPDSAYYRAIRRGRDEHIAVDPTRRSDRRDNTEPLNEPEPQQNGPSMEFAVPIDKAALVVEIMTREIARDTINFVGPIGIRFVKASDHFVCPEYGQDLAFVELAGLLAPNKSKKWPEHQRVYRAFFKKLERAVRAEVPETVLHLGKVNTYTPAKLRNDFDRFDDWLQMYAVFSRSGVFDCPIATTWKLKQAAPTMTMAQARSTMEGMRIRRAGVKPKLGKG